MVTFVNYMTVVAALVAEDEPYVYGEQVILHSVDSLVCELFITPNGIHKRL